MTSPSCLPTLWYRRPASQWMTEALPIGNGTLGAMLFGGIDTERVQFNVDSLWTGDENDTGHYQAFGDVWIELNHREAKSYRRELDINRALHSVSYTYDGIGYSQTAFCSHPAQVLVLHLMADEPGSYSGHLRLTDSHEAPIRFENGRLTVTGRLENGLEYEAQLLVLHVGGTVQVENSQGIEISFENCHSLTLILAADTNYMPDFERNWRGPSPHQTVTERIDRAVEMGFEALWTGHVADYAALFGRFTLDLGQTAAPIAALSTNERLLAYHQNENLDPELEALFCQYGRYLMIASSRLGSLPANLQGLWNDSNTPMWRCDYHSNINVQMNYWPVEVTNLALCHIPFIDYVCNQREVRKLATHEHYGEVRGWTVQTENGIFGGSDFKWNPPGSAWYAQHLWEHFAFGRDEQYLRQAAYPVLREVCEFWEDHLIQRADGTLVSPDGWSPEHGPTGEGVMYDTQIVWDLFTNAMEAAQELGIDEPFCQRLIDLRDRLMAPKVGRWGQLQEWEEDVDDPEGHHRHASHLFALHPSRQISPCGTPQLAQAARISLEARGDGGTGWSRAWKISFWARLLDGDHAYLLLRHVLTPVFSTDTDYENSGGVYFNLLDAHPPFQIDGNFGATAGIAEMLLQSHLGEVHLLPALPMAWATGSVNGVRARGGFELDLEWSQGKLQSATIRSSIKSPCLLRYEQKLIEVHLEAGQTVTFDGNLNPVSL